MTKAEATEGAKQAFERWLNRGSDEEVVAPKPDIPVGQCFKNFLAYSLERAHNPDEKFGLGSQQNHNCILHNIRGPYDCINTPCDLTYRW